MDNKTINNLNYVRTPTIQLNHCHYKSSIGLVVTSWASWWMPLVDISFEISLVTQISHCRFPLIMEFSDSIDLTRVINAILFFRQKWHFWNYRWVKEIDMNGYFSDFLSWYDVSTWNAWCVKSSAPDNAVTVRKLNIHEMLKTCHSDVNRDRIQVIWGKCMFSRSRSSFCKVKFVYLAMVHLW